MVESLLILLTRICCGLIVRCVNEDFRKPGVIFFANHTSHLDLLVILSVFPAAQRRRIRPVAAQDYWTRGPVRRYIALHVLHAILMDRKHPMKTRAGFDAIAAALDAGDSVLIFPEGSRHDREEPGEFRGGIHHLAEARPETAFVPVALHGLYRTLPKGEFLPAPNVGRVCFGKALQLEPAESRAAFLARCREALIATGRWNDD